MGPIMQIKAIQDVRLYWHHSPLLVGRGSGCRWWAGSQPPLLSAVVEEVMHHVPQDGGVRRTAALFPPSISPQEEKHAGNLAADESRIHQKDKQSEQTAATAAKGRASGGWRERERVVTGTQCQMASVNNHPLFFTGRDKHTLHSHQGFFLGVFKEALPRSDACGCEPFRKGEKKKNAGVEAGGGGRTAGDQTGPV